jgi:hypothetical protein
MTNDPYAYVLFIFALFGAVTAISNLIRIARKGVSRVSRARTAPERLDLFSPDVVPGAMRRPDPFTGAVSHPIPEPGQKRDAGGITFADSPVFVDPHLDAKPPDHDWPERSPNDLILAHEAKRRADGLACSGPYCDQPHTLAELERIVDPEC